MQSNQNFNFLEISHTKVAISPSSRQPVTLDLSDPFSLIVRQNIKNSLGETKSNSYK